MVLTAINAIHRVRSLDFCLRKKAHTVAPARNANKPPREPLKTAVVNPHTMKAIKINAQILFF
jgi:hypothetical protein